MRNYETMKLWLTAIAAPAILLALPSASAADSRSLAGAWRFQLDRQDVGIREQWHARRLPDTIRLPGSLPAQGIGDDITVSTPWVGGVKGSAWYTSPEYARYRQPGHVKFPYWLQPDKYYKGVAWYQRDFEIPKDWSDKRVVLSLERPHWETRVWVDDKLIGTNDSLGTPHEHDLGRLAPGQHTLSIRVDNRMVIDIGENSHAISDHTQGDWNGIVGDISLRATPPIWIDNVQVFPNPQKRTARVEVAVGNQYPKAVKIQLNLSSQTFDMRLAPPIKAEPLEADIPPGGTRIETELPFGDAFWLWDEFHPRLYFLGAQIEKIDDPSVCDVRNDVTFGIRDFTTQGTQFLMNGRKTFIRGTLECCIFPKTGHPPTEVEDWRRVIRVAKAHGLNLLRFHSYCPPEAAFEAGDELGMYFQIETCWPNQSTTLGDGKPVDDWVWRETERILKTYGNHPSFMLMAHGNEPGGKKPARGKDGDPEHHGGYTEYLSKYVEHFKSLDPRHLWTSGSGWPQVPENQFHVTPDPRVQAWGAGLNSRLNAKPPETTTDYRDYIGRRTVPVISHEIGQWCVYPNFDEISKYTGYLKPKNFEIFRDTLAAHHLGGQARAFLLASGKLQTLCYKEDIESALRTPGMGGFELLDLHDFPGQGTALVGVLDPFWEDKGYVTAAEYRRFCNYTVPLARLGKRVFTTEEKLEADIEAANFGPEAGERALMTWKLIDDAQDVVAKGSLPARDLPADNGIEFGRCSIDLAKVPAPARLKLVAALHIGPGRETSGGTFENDWDVWVYPPRVNTAPPPGVTVAAELDAQTAKTLQDGGKVLLLMPPARVRNDSSAPVSLGFSSIFWNTAWTGRQAPTTLGILCNPKAPALAEFPTDDHSNWQWWYLLSNAKPMILDGLPAKLHPTVQVIDDWVTARKLGLLIEAKVGRGKLMVCSIDLRKDPGSNPVAAQMLHSLFDYMAGPRFKPAVTLTPDQVRGVMVGTQDTTK
jgi:hypothetical protein